MPSRLAERRRAKLKVALLAEVEFLRGLQGPQAFALAFDKHRQLVGDLVRGGDPQRTAGPTNACFLRSSCVMTASSINAVGCPVDRRGAREEAV